MDCMTIRLIKCCIDMTSDQQLALADAITSLGDLAARGPVSDATLQETLVAHGVILAVPAKTCE